MRRIRTMAAVLLLALVASGCTSFNGGGWLRSKVFETNPLTTEKATFGINGKCKSGQFKMAGEVVRGAGLFDGQFEYDDHAFKMRGVGVKFHGRVSATATNTPIVALGITCRQLEAFLAGDSAGVVEFRGTYRPKNQNLATMCSSNPARSTCTFVGTLSDLGEPGIKAGDFFSISLQGGPFVGYTNAGPLEGGNLQVR